jgi:pilus assembly protein CpaC
MKILRINNLMVRIRVMTRLKKNHSSDAVRLGVVCFCILTTAVFFSAGALAETLVTAISAPAEQINLTPGKSIVFKADRVISRITIGNPDVVSYVSLSPKEIYITGKNSGSTNMMVWFDDSSVMVYDIATSFDTALLKERLHELLPDETNIKVIPTGSSITLSGTVSSTVNLAQAVAVAEACAPGGKINNLLEVSGIHQVMLEVRVAEMSKSLIKRMGINFNWITQTGRFGISSLGGLTNVDISNLTKGLTTTYTTSVNALFNFSSQDATWTAFIDALKSDGLIKILAEPTLVSMSGQTAKFLAGGEFPIPVPGQNGTVGIEYKEFGVSLEFTPTVIGKDRISMHVKPIVSELDFSSNLQFAGYVVPGLSTRSASTVIELGDGQSFALAGLLQDKVTDQVDRVPVLGDIPVLGTLFKSRSFQKSESELLIIVTPHLAKTINGDTQALPTDNYVEPGDFTFYLTKEFTGSTKTGDVQSGKMEGDFGHAMPKE